MTQDDDDLWLDALAGRTTRDTPSAREALSLRAAILARDVADPTVLQNDPVREQSLLERARRDGLIVAPRPRHQPRGLRLSLAAAAVVFFGLTMWLVDLPNDEAVVVRSGPDGTIHLEAIDPRALKQRLLTDLRAAGVPASGYERLGAEGIDAELPDVLTRDIVIVLDRYGIAAPADGVLRVEIVAPDQGRRVERDDG